MTETEGENRIEKKEIRWGRKIDYVEIH